MKRRAKEMNHLDMHKKRLVEEYEINPSTMIILPQIYGKKIYSRIFEVEDEFLSPFKPFDIVKKSCGYFGSSYEGRKDATKDIIGVTHKVPIVIDPTNLLYFFPTTSPNNPDCIWISYEHIAAHHRTDPSHTKVVFGNKHTLILPVSSSSFENQLLRTAHLRTKLHQRIEGHGRKMFYFTDNQRLNRASEPVGSYRNRKLE
jgi:competence protein ComK